MGIYEKFAYIYAAGEYPDFSRRMAEILPSVLQHLDVRPESVLDLACGEGTFATALARQGFKVTGLDISSEMLALARERVREAGVAVELRHGDMRALTFDHEFDLVTCWFDSLNYLLDSTDLKKTFKGVRNALKPAGLFIFDMNTIYGLAVNWREYPCYVQKDTAGMFEIHSQDYDFEANIATMRITGFLKEGDLWSRVDEEHRERGYSQREIRSLLEDSGFQVLAVWGSFRDMSDAGPESGRVWYAAKTLPEWAP